MHNILDLTGLASDRLDVFSDVMKASSKWGNNPVKLMDGIKAETGAKAIKALETGGDFGRESKRAVQELKAVAGAEGIHLKPSVSRKVDVFKDSFVTTEKAVKGGSYTLKNKTTLWGQQKYVTEDGLNTVKQHLSGDLADEFNDAMISRLESAYANNTPIEGADLDFYAHEIYESTLMKNGMSYEDAHEAAKAYYNATEFNLYHPEVIKANPKLFNNAWFEFWGIERD